MSAATPAQRRQAAEPAPATATELACEQAAGIEPARTRRSLLAAVAGAAVGLVGSRLAAPDAVAAANGDALKLGQSNSASGLTSLVSSSDGLKVTGAVGVSGHSDSAIGVGLAGSATNGAGTNYGVLATAWGVTGVGVKGTSRTGTGVVGHCYTSNDFTQVPPVKTGVYGFAAHDASAMGVVGESKAGLGVKGKATSGSGVYGTTQSGFGVVGFGGTGVGGLFQTGSAMVGVALQTVGRVKFDKSVGKATITAGTRSVTVSPGIDLTTTSAAVATLQGSAGGAMVERVAIDTTANTLTIWLSKNTTAAVSVAWHVFG